MRGSKAKELRRAAYQYVLNGGRIKRRVNNVKQRLVSTTRHVYQALKGRRDA